MDAIEKGYRDWWAKHTPAERAALQGLDGHNHPREVLDVIDDADGIPSQVGMVDNPDHGTVTVPGFVRSWDPKDAYPIAQRDIEETP